MTDGDVLFREAEGIAVIELARPDKFNSLTMRMLVRLEEVAAAIDASRTIRAAVMTGQGKAFCGGADILDWGRLSPLEMARDWVRNGHRIFDRIARLRPPLLMAVNGHALGGGLELAACGDLRIVEEQAKVGLPEVGIGIVPGWSGTQRLVRRAGPGAVRRLALTGEPVTAAEAVRLGLCDEIAPKGQAFGRAMELARSIASRAPVAVELVKQMINAAEGEEISMPLEAMAGALAAYTDDNREGVASFREKRRPEFGNR